MTATLMMIGISAMAYGLYWIHPALAITFGGFVLLHLAMASDS